MLLFQILQVVEDAAVVVGDVVVVVALNVLILNALVIMKISVAPLLASKKSW
jgi:hypothetical protein